MTITLSEIHEQLQEVFQLVFDDDDLVIFPEMTAHDVEDWDSMNHINLVVACEKKFNVKFALAEISELPNVGALEKLIGQKLAK